MAVRPLLVALAALLVIAVVLGSPAGQLTVDPTVPAIPATDAAGDGTELTVDASSAPDVTVSVERSGTDGRPIDYDVSVAGLERVDHLWILTANATAVAATGLVATEDPRRLRWDRTSERVDASFAPAASPDAPTTTGEGWAFGPVPTLVVAWQSGDGPVHRVRPLVAREAPFVSVMAPAGSVVGSRFAMVGSTSVHEGATASGRFRVVVPGGVTPTADPDYVVRAIQAAASRFPVGGEPRDALVFVVPGVRAGGATVVARDETWVNAAAPLWTAENVYLHEYVHTRQSFALGPRMAWYREASAEYHGATLAREVGLATDADLAVHLLGRDRAGARLTDPTTWADDQVPYDRGAVVLAALDRELRERTDGERSLVDVVRRMNEARGTITYDRFAAIVSAVAGEDVRPWLARHVDGTEPVGQVAALRERLAPLSVLFGVGTLGTVAARRRARGTTSSARSPSRCRRCRRRPPGR